MKKIFYLFLIVIVLMTSCRAAALFNERLSQLSLGMSKTEVTAIMGDRYLVLQAVKTPEGNLECLRYNYDISYHYLFYFLDGELVEYVKQLTNDSYPYNTTSWNSGEDVCVRDNHGRPIIIGRNTMDDVLIQDNTGKRVIVKKDLSGNPLIEDRQGRNITFRKDIMDNYTADTGTERIAVRRDILGNLDYKGSDGKSASFEKDILDNYTYSDSKGNELIYKKEEWESVMAKFDDDQVLFIYLIKKYLY